VVVEEGKDVSQGAAELGDLLQWESRHYPSADCGIVAEVDAPRDPGLDDPFEEAIDEALSSLPADFRAAISNVAILVEDELPDGRLLGLYSGVPLPMRAWGLCRAPECCPPRSATSAGRSRDSLPATPIVYAVRSYTSCSTSLRITSRSSDARSIELDRD
jgi:hypothetical protein